MIIKHQLSNGLTLLLEPTAAATISAGYFIATGSCEESPIEMGMSHFLEHLMFKGNDQMNASEMNILLDELGDDYNALTGEESTVYYAATIPEQTHKLLTTLTELLRPALRTSDIETERLVILEEIAMYADQPSTRMMDTLNAQFWPGSLGQPILGTTETVSALTPEMLRDYFQRKYGASRVTLAIVGSFDPHQIITWAEEQLSHWPSGEAPCRTSVIPSSTGSSHITVSDLQRFQWAFAGKGVPVTHPLREAATILADILGGESGALYWELVDTGLCDSAYLQHMELAAGGSYWGNLSCDPSRAAEAIARYQDVLSRADTFITSQSVTRAAKRAAVSSVLSDQTSQGRLFSLGSEYLLTGAIQSTEEQMQRWLAVTPEQVHEVLGLCPPQTECVVSMGSN